MGSTPTDTPLRPVLELNVGHIPNVGPRDLLTLTVPRDPEVSELDIAVAVGRAALSRGLRPWVILLPAGYKLERVRMWSDEKLNVAKVTRR